MGNTLHDLGDLLVKSVPTILFFVFLIFYLKAVLFRPLARILDERKKATEGVRQLAQQAFEAADQRGSEVERILAQARTDLHKRQEEMRHRWADELSQKIAAARAQAAHQVEEARHQIAAEVARTQSELDASVENLSEQVVASLLRRRAA